MRRDVENQIYMIVSNIVNKSFIKINKIKLVYSVKV